MVHSFSWLNKLSFKKLKSDIKTLIEGKEMKIFNFLLSSKFTKPILKHADKVEQYIAENRMTELEIKRAKQISLETPYSFLQALNVVKAERDRRELTQRMFNGND